MDGNTSMHIHLDNDNILCDFGDKKVYDYKSYINLLADFIVEKTDYNTEIINKISGDCKDTFLLRLKQQLFACKIYISWSLLMHLVGFDSRNKICTDFIDLFIKNKSSEIPVCNLDKNDEHYNNYDYECRFSEKYHRTLYKLKLSTTDVLKYLNFYKEGLYPKLSIQYHHMHKQFAYALSYESFDKYIEFPNSEEDYAYLESRSVDILSKCSNFKGDISEFVIELLDNEICFIEEFMSCPYKMEEVHSNPNHHWSLSNTKKWDFIARELCSILRTGFDKIITYKDNPYYFETDYDDYKKLVNSLKIKIENSCLALAEKYDLWVSQNMFNSFPTDIVIHLAFYDNEGDWYAGIHVRKKDEVSFFNFFGKKKTKLFISTVVYGFSRPDLYAFHKLEFNYGADNTKVILHKQGFKKDLKL